MLTRQALLVHIPHASAVLPEEHKAVFSLPEAELQRELDIMTDWHMDKLLQSDERVVFPYSRLFCDVERYENDEKEPMSKLGMGFYYERTHDGKELRPATRALRFEVLREFYIPYHRKLFAKAREIIIENGFCVLLDCHSYDDSVPWVVGKNCPDICLGLNEEIPDLVTQAAMLCERYQYSFAVNEPFSGSIVPEDLHAKWFLTVMLEVNKRVYIKDGHELMASEFQNLKEFAEELVQLIITQANNGEKKAKLVDVGGGWYRDVNGYLVRIEDQSQGMPNEDRRKFWEWKIAHGELKAFDSQAIKDRVEILLGRELDFPIKEPDEPHLSVEANENVAVSCDKESQK
jgi:N-formylglutamate amidohydrolase